MLYGHDDEGIIHGLLELLLDVSYGVSERGSSIRQEDLQSVIWNHHHTDVDQSLVYAVSQMYDIAHQHVTTAKPEARLQGGQETSGYIVASLSSRCRLNQFFPSRLSLQIQHRSKLAQNRRAICLSLFFEPDIHREEDIL